MSQDQPRRVAILGAGLTGLAAAYELSRSRPGERPVEVAVFEAETRVGGRLRTDGHEDAVFEAGAYALNSRRPQALELARELGLGGKEIRARDLGPPAVVCAGRLHRLPAGLRGDGPPRLLPVLGSPLLSWKGKLRLLCEPAVRGLDGEADEPLAAFLARRLGPEAAEALAVPLLESGCAGDASALSAVSGAPGLVELERRGGLLRGLARGGWPVCGLEPGGAAAVRFQGGLRVLSEAIAARLPRPALRLGSAVTRLVRRGAAWEVRAERGAESFDAVIAALPAPALAGVVGNLDPELAGILRG
ncbi:MAG: FAD-dependent oxidoreductase, partial [Elusimicrobia bacterium]|nr:FAD-dependent oxidoreductase [Elusimicrobiota bacterium]